MPELIDLWEEPKAKEIYMIAGWRQWADAGSISSVLPQYLINQTRAKKIGEIPPDGYYIFQVPGTHHFLRPVIKLNDGYRDELEIRQNEIYYSGDSEKGLLIFLGDEPHMDVERYTRAFFEIIKRLNVKRVAVVGGVYGALPYDRERDISCIYSLPDMREELDSYAVRFSNYEGGATIGSYLVDQAEKSNVEFVAFYAFVPAYDFSEDINSPHGIRIESDYKAWHDLMRRINHMFGMNVSLADLEEKSGELIAVVSGQIQQMLSDMPDLQIEEYLNQIEEGFTERTFAPLDDVWEQGLADLFTDMDESDEDGS